MQYFCMKLVLDNKHDKYLVNTMDTGDPVL